MRIFLVRHGESQGNVDKTVHHHVADHAIPLSDKGREQARDAGTYLARWFVARDRCVPAENVVVTDSKLLLRYGDGPLLPGVGVYTTSGKFPFRLWTSPYRRTRETSEGILASIKDLTNAVPGSGVREHIMLAEQQFGLFDGLSDEELEKRYPDEYAHYKKCENMKGRFWARMPLGESRFDVAVRVHQAFGTFHRDAEKHGIRDLVVVCHGTTIRAFVMQWLHLPVEWFEKEPNPKNCSIRLIEGSEDRGYIYGGG